MWKNWRKKVSDFFYEDVIEEDESEQQVQFEEKDILKNRAQVNDNQTVHTKIAYKYPKKQNAPFRFPVIPDEQTERKIAKRQVTQRRGRKRQRQIDRTHSNQERLIHGYNEKKSQKELEEVPAFIRRQKAKQRVREKEAKQKVEKIEVEEKVEIIHHSSPDELDRVFKIRDGLLDNEHDDEMTGLDEGIEQKQVEETISYAETLEKLSPIEQVVERNIPQVKEEPAAKPINIEEFQGIKEFEFPPEKVEEIQQPQMNDKAVPDFLLNDPVEREEDDAFWLEEQQMLLEQTLEHFNIDAKIVNITQGPSVTRFEIQPALGVKVSRVRNLADDFKLNMAAKDIRIEAPIPGKNTIGIEVPNKYAQVVSLQQIIETDAFKHATSPLTVALGLTIEGKPLITDIGKMPHGLIAGATGSGKSVCINTILLSLLYKAHYNEVKFLLIDPKMVELSPYNGIPHLISPVITDVKAATMALKWAVNEMEERYERFVEAGVRNITKYNEKMVKLNKVNEKMPFIVIVIDELADLMMVSPQDVEDAICRIAQKARACGIHLLVATQRPSVDVITGLIKANIPTRIAFSVSSQVDSRTMIDTAGAEKLLGKGDMLFVENGANKSLRLQGPFVSDEEIDRVAHYMRSIAKPNYLFEQEQLLLDIEDETEDELLHDVISFVVEQNQASTSLLQRRFRIGYNRAARLIDTLENKGIVSAQNGSKPREVLISKSQME